MERTVWIIENTDGHRVRAYPETLADNDAAILQSGATIVLNDESFHLVNVVED